MINEAAYPEKRKWRELSQACKERAGNQCEFVDPRTGKRCPAREEQIRRSRHSGRRYFVYLHAAHLSNTDPGNLEPALICLCPRHHLAMDRQAELSERLSTRRRGYRITSTDQLVEEARSAGVLLQEQVDGYTWEIPSQAMAGRATTAARAICNAAYHLRCELDRVLQAQRRREDEDA